MLTARYQRLFAKGIIVGLDGDDNRHDTIDLKPAIAEHIMMAARGSGVAIALRSSAFQHPEQDGYNLSTRRETLRNAPDDDGFAGQRRLKRTGATSFLVTPRHVVTAAHFLPTGGASALAFAFGYRAEADWRTENRSRSPAYRFERAQVFFGTRRVKTLGDGDVDIAVIELDRDVLPAIANPLPVAPVGAVDVGQEVGMIGFPRGLPCKHVVGDPPRLVWPSVHRIEGNFVLTDVDSFQSNSGSPLLDLDGRVIAVKIGDSEIGDVIPGTNTVQRATKPGHAVAARLDAIAPTLRSIGVNI